MTANGRLLVILFSMLAIDTILDITLNSVWHEEHLWIFSVLQRIHFPILLLCVNGARVKVKLSLVLVNHIAKKMYGVVEV